MAKSWAETLGPEAGMKMLLKLNLVDAVIEYFIELKDFDEAFKMANQNAKHKTTDVHLKYALYLEDEKRLMPILFFLILKKRYETFKFKILIS